MNSGVGLADVGTGTALLSDPLLVANVNTGNKALNHTFKDPSKALNSNGEATEVPDIVREMSYPTPFATSPLLPLLLLSLARQKHTPKTTTSFAIEYDYVIVGAGTAGSVVASRLSEDTGITVLLLEAGKPPPLVSDVPAISGYLAKTDIDWNYNSVPQRNAAFGITNREVPWPKGKTIGGTSIINGMIYVRGNHRNYDEWAANGATGWGWNDVFPYFLKLENNTDKDISNNGFHYTGGPLTVERYPTESAFKDVPPTAASELGYSFLDVNGASQIGFTDLQGNLRNRQRCSTAKAYLVPAENRTNLDIVAEAFVTKILINETRAVGVQFDLNNGSRHEVRARREVIVSAGAVNTPKLLMLSGIGPREILEKYGIFVLSDLPVGENFHDHVATILNYVVRSDVPPFLTQIQNPFNLLRYIRNRSGPLATSGGLYSLSFFTSTGDRNASVVPDQELYFFESVPSSTMQRFGLDASTYAQLYNPYRTRTTIWCMSHSLHPRSRGNVTIRSNNPYDSPVIDPNYYSDPQDLEDVVTGMKMCNAIAASSAMKKFKTRPFTTLMRGCENFVEDEDEYFRCYARHFVFAPCHDVGTAKMGDPSDKATVVDPELRVKGIDCLRVVDASIMPSIPTGNTHDPVIMIGEKAADMIKKCQKCADTKLV